MGGLFYGGPGFPNGGPGFPNGGPGFSNWEPDFPNGNPVSPIGEDFFIPFQFLAFSGLKIHILKTWLLILNIKLISKQVFFSLVCATGLSLVWQTYHAGEKLRLTKGIIGLSKIPVLSFKKYIFRVNTARPTGFCSLLTKRDLIDSLIDKLNFIIPGFDMSKKITGFDNMIRINNITINYPILFNNPCNHTYSFL